MSAQSRVSRRYYLVHREEILEKHKKYRDSHKALCCAKSKRHRERIKSGVDWCREKYGVHWRKEVRKMFVLDS